MSSIEVEQDLQDSWDSYVIGLGSTPYDSNLEDCFKARFRASVTKKLDRFEEQRVAVMAKCVQGGNDSAAMMRTTTNVTSLEMLTAFQNIALGGGTVFC